MAKYDTLISSARNLADMITLCERIEWGQDSAKLHECAEAIEALQAENERLRAALERIACRHQSLDLLWWQEEAREALKGENDA